LRDDVEHIIEVQHLTHRFNDFIAVDDVSFTVEKGEIFSFLGPNGAGKSTVINILTTLLRLQQGSVTIAGHDLTKEPVQVRKSIGIVFQQETLDRDMTVWETLEFHGRLYGLARADRQERIEKLLSLVELEKKRDDLTRNLSGGMKRRLEIGRGLMTRPAVLFLDEPTIGLDPQTRTRMWEYLREVNEEGTTIFLTTHYMDEADQLSNHINIIDRGRIIISGRSWELKNTLGQDLIYVETTDNDVAARVLKENPSVSQVKPKGKGLLTMITEDGTRLLPGILESLQKEGVRLTAVNLKKPSMDDVFMHYTGKDLRDEEQPRVQPQARRTRR
jgi:ABC-2 type transport system ATP-binding protein